MQGPNGAAQNSSRKNFRHLRDIGTNEKIRRSIKMDFKETGCEGLNWILLAQDRRSAGLV